MVRRGRKRRLSLEDKYWLLLAAGVGTKEACRQTASAARPAAGGEQNAAEYHRSPWPSRRGPDGTCRRWSGSGSRRRRSGRLLADSELRQVVQSRLELEWSPEQIAAWLRREYPGLKAWHVCHETIYKALYWGGDGGLSRTLTARLRTGRPLRKRRRRSTHRRGRFVVPISLIDNRPAIVAERSRLGDGEGDLIVGRGGRSAIGTLVDRTSRLVKLVHLPAGYMAVALAAAVDAIPLAARLTLTWDQGSEMARHDLLARHFPEGVYFAQPGSPWLRGTNENTNGLLRQYFPKGTDLSVHDEADLRRVEDLLNNRPRRTLRWQTPAEVFKAQLAS